MSIEKQIEGVIKEQMEAGVIEKVVAEQFQKAAEKAVDHLFSSYGDVTKIIEKQVKSVLVPYLENYDYSEYIVKLDHVLVEILKSTALDNKKILENFQDLMSFEKPDKITTSQIFEKWRKYAAKEVETHGLEVQFDDRPSYESFEVSMEVHEDESNHRSWSSMEYVTVIFENEHDEKLNKSFRMYRWKDRKSDGWTVDNRREIDLNSLKYLDEFEIFLMQLSQSFAKVEIDEWNDSDSVEPEAEPEPDWS
jgi:hypothetical protein